MNKPDKLPLLVSTFKILLNNLKPDDRVAIVTYASREGLLLPSTRVKDKQHILDKLTELHAVGRTAGGAGIQLAYKIAKENYLKNGNNRVILATDGDFNVGIKDADELTKFIKDNHKDGIFLTVLGFGQGNYKDSRLQKLADMGNGHHAYIDNIIEAEKVMSTELSSTLYTIAKDVKIQVEFNPAKIASYRLVGYENRLLNDEDFEDDKKDAGEIGAGHSVTALYEVIPVAEPTNIIGRPLKYQQTIIKDSALLTDEILTVSIRYKEPKELKSKEFSSTLHEFTPPEKTSANFRLAASAAEFGLLLRNSEFAADANIENALKLAESTLEMDKYGYIAEYINLIKRAGFLLDQQLASEF